MCFFKEQLQDANASDEKFDEWKKTAHKGPTVYYLYPKFDFSSDEDWLI